MERVHEVAREGKSVSCRELEALHRGHRELPGAGPDIEDFDAVRQESAKARGGRFHVHRLRENHVELLTLGLDARRESAGKRESHARVEALRERERKLRPAKHSLESPHEVEMR
jgi:hypothetical protein